MYHYTECGLDNVWLENGYTVKKTAYGKATSVDDADGLHQVLSIELTQKKGRVTGKELRFMRTALGMSQEGLGKCVGATEQSVSLWERTGKVPQYADSILRLLVSEKLNGNSKVTEVIERINTVERICNQRIVAREKKHKWTSTTVVKIENDERVALAA
jgi:DNA-binding transcriptional regulator YiaG